MKLRKKALAGFVATSLAVTSLAGVSITANGATVNLGVNVASAADANLQKLIELQKKLNSSLATNANVLALKVALSGVDHEDAVAPLYAPFSSLGLTDEEKSALIGLLKGIVLAPVDNEAEFIELLQTTEVKSLIGEIERDSGIDITVEDFAALFVALNDKAYSALISNPTYAGGKTAFVESIAEAVLGGDTSGAQKASDLIEHYFTSNANFKSAVLDTFENYMAAPGVKDAFDAALPSIVGAFASANAPVYGGGGGGVVQAGNTDVAKALETLAGLKDKIAKATGDEKAALIKQAIDTANAALASAANVDVSKLVAISGDQASIKIDAAAIASFLKDLAALKAALAAAVGNADGFVVPTLTFNLGTVAQASIAVSLPADVIAQLTTAGVAKVAFAVNGLTATLPISGDFAKGIDFKLNHKAATSAETGGRKAVSELYDFSLALGGEAVTKFNQPIFIKFPFQTVAGVDQEKLTVARVESNGTLKVQGGDVVGNTITDNFRHFSPYVVVENKVSFNDISSVQAWAGRQIEVIAAKGVVEGKAAGKFAPQDKITRAEFAKILVTALNIENDDATTDKFTDVRPGDWYAPYVAVAAEEGIINGRTATTFAPTATISRAEMSTMIARALKSVKGVEDVANAEAALASFSDAGQIIPSLKEGVALAASKNIVIGTDGKFKPNDNATRAEAAVIVYRTINTK